MNKNWHSSPTMVMGERGGQPASFGGGTSGLSPCPSAQIANQDTGSSLPSAVSVPGHRFQIQKTKNEEHKRPRPAHSDCCSILIHSSLESRLYVWIQGFSVWRLDVVGCFLELQ